MAFNNEIQTSIGSVLTIFTVDLGSSSSEILFKTSQRIKRKIENGYHWSAEFDENFLNSIITGDDPYDSITSKCLLRAEIFET